MLVRSGGGFAIVDLPPGKLDVGDRRMSLADLKVSLDRTAEWQQIFNESWRQMRDFFFDANLHRVDWPAMKQRKALRFSSWGSTPMGMSPRAQAAASGHTAG